MLYASFLGCLEAVRLWYGVGQVIHQRAGCIVWQMFFLNLNRCCIPEIDGANCTMGKFDDWKQHTYYFASSDDLCNYCPGANEHNKCSRTKANETCGGADIIYDKDNYVPDSVAMQVFTHAHTHSNWKY
jgi:hypothetical protein